MQFNEIVEFVRSGREAVIFQSVIEIGTESEKTILPAITEMWQQAGILANGQTLTEYYTTETTKGRKDFIVPLPKHGVNIGLLSLWRIRDGLAFDAKWASDYIVNASRLHKVK